MEDRSESGHVQLSPFLRKAKDPVGHPRCQVAAKAFCLLIGEFWDLFSPLKILQSPEGSTAAYQLPWFMHAKVPNKNGQGT